MRLSFRTTQLLGSTLVVAVMGAFTTYAGYSFISETVVEEAKLRVQMDLNSAWAAFDEESTRLQMAVGLISQREIVKRALIAPIDSAVVGAQLEELRLRHGLDFLTLIDRRGVVKGGSQKSAPLGESIRRDPVIDGALEGNVTWGNVLISGADLSRKHPQLAEQAYVRIEETARARPTTKRFEDRGMALEAAIPVLGPDDRINGALYGGILLNRRHALVDRVRHAVFSDTIYEGRPLGTVTIFLWDVRIATNVLKADSTRALGTRVSEEVYRKVLERGERFADRAFVVNDWYLSAYDPIKDPDGQVIGILYVGLLERKYLDYGSRLTMAFLGISFVALLFSVGLAFTLSARFRRPVVRLVKATRELSAGNLDSRVLVDEGSSEMVELARAFNSMAQSLETRSNQLQQASLDLKKAYTEADEKNRAYLEMLGFVTHELKSPLATIVFAIGSLRDHVLGPLNQSQESLLKACANSADYLHSTIANYLNLSRIEEGQLHLKPRRVPFRATTIDPVIQRLADMAADNRMTIACDVPYDLEVTCDADLVVSVLQNLISNALKYGSQGGRIEIRVEKQTGSDTLTVSVFNEGPGFSPEEAKGLFTKFSRFSAEHYNTKSGTGLGLFVSKSIVEKHGGTIWAESEAGAWARFAFTLPLEATPEPEPAARKRMSDARHPDSDLALGSQGGRGE